MVVLFKEVKIKLHTAVKLLLSTKAELINNNTVISKYIIVFNKLKNTILNKLNPILVYYKVVALVLIISKELVDADTLKLLLVKINIKILKDDTIYKGCYCGHLGKPLGEPLDTS